MPARTRHAAAPATAPESKPRPAAAAEEEEEASGSDLTPPPDAMDELEEEEEEDETPADAHNDDHGEDAAATPRRSRNAAAAAATPGLRFSLPLSWRAGRPPIAVAELLKRLQALSAEMRGMEQIEDDEVRKTFAPAAKQLASEQLLGHKDKGVRAWAASCSVDVLRLCAPYAPFSAREMKAVFEMMLKSILPTLSDPSNAYNTQHMYVLQSLAQVKSIVLVTDLPNADSLILHLFTSFFDILSGSAKSSTGEQLAKAVEFNMTAILATLVDELPGVPQDVVDTIMAQFLRVDSRVTSHSTGKTKKGVAVEEKQSTLEIKELPSAYIIAKTVCNTCSEKMAHEVSKYFSDVIMEATASSRERRRESGDADGFDESAIGPSEEDLKELSKAHRLLRELWRACPAVLQNVIPQLEAELAAENVRLRLLATETLADIVSGIGAAGPPLPPTIDPAAYPPLTLSSASEPPTIVNLWTIPASPQSFPQAHPTPYAAFLGRGNDKSPLIRAARATGIGRIVATSAGGVGLSSGEESQLVEEMARVLNDSDERVRLAAVRAVSNLGFAGVVNKLGSGAGSVDTSSSVLANLSERVKDKKHTVREEAMTTLANIWAAATGEIADGNAQVRDLIGGASSKILNASYTNDPEILALIDSVLFEILLPLKYPPIKSKGLKAANGSSQRVKDSQAQSDDEQSSTLDPDKIRVARFLLLANGLDERAKKVFFSISGRQVIMSKYMMAFIKSCEEYNAGVMDKDEAIIKGKLTRLIAEIAKFLPEPSRASSDLWKFAQMHDRRNYQLLRYCMAPDSDYRTVYNAIKEFKKRIESSTSPGLMETFKPLLYRSSILIYNKSHVPAIMLYSRTDEMGLSNTAHEVLTEISQRSPEVLKANVSEICMSLQEDAPTSSKPNSIGAVDSLKACAAFARKFTDEIPQDAKFVKAMTSFALLGTPPEAAKHAVSIIIASSKKKEMLARDLAQKCVTGYEYGKVGFTSRLATLSRLSLLAPAQVDDYADEMIDIATKELLLKVREPSAETADAYEWSSELDEECTAKCWALRILVNRIRSHTDAATLEQVSKPVYALLDKLIAQEGELSSAKNTPPTHKSRLRLIAARSYLKLALSKNHDVLIDPQAFQNLALVAQDPLYKVRASLLQRLKKYLGHNSLGPRFYTIPFLLTYEPEPVFLAETVTWLRSRALFFANYKAQSSTDANARAAASKASTTLEAVFPRLLSLLAHHPDYGDEPEELRDLARYMIFYLSTVASETNVSLIFHVAQRVKACNDAMVPPTPSPVKGKSPSARAAAANADMTAFTLRLHTLSDLATLTLRSWIEAHGWTLQSLPARLTLPRSLFTEIKDHSEALRIAGQNFIPDADATGLSDDIDKLVRATMRKGGSSGHASGAGGGSKKRKSEAAADGGAAIKRAKASRNSGAIKGEKKERKTPKKRAHDWDGSDDEEGDDGAEAGGEGGGTARGTKRRAGGGESSASRRKSARGAGAASGVYRERDDSEDDEEMADANDEDEEEEDDGDDEEDEGEEEEAENNEPTSSRPAATPSSRTRKPPARSHAAAAAVDANSSKSKNSPRIATLPSKQTKPAAAAAAAAAPASSRKKLAKSTATNGAVSSSSPAPAPATATPTRSSRRGRGGSAKAAADGEGGDAEGESASVNTPSKAMTTATTNLPERSGQGQGQGQGRTRGLRSRG